MAAEPVHVDIKVSPKVYKNLAEMAKMAGLSPTAYASALFIAAYSARCKPTGDRDLDAAVACVAVLFGDRHFNTAQIAKLVRLSEATVVRIIDRWKAETLGMAA